MHRLSTNVTHLQLAEGPISRHGWMSPGFPHSFPSLSVSVYVSPSDCARALLAACPLDEASSHARRDFSIQGRPFFPPATQRLIASGVIRHVRLSLMIFFVPQTNRPVCSRQSADSGVIICLITAGVIAFARPCCTSSLRREGAPAYLFHLRRNSLPVWLPLTLELLFCGGHG